MCGKQGLASKYLGGGIAVAAASLTWEHEFKEPQTKPAKRVGSVVLKPAN